MDPKQFTIDNMCRHKHIVNIYIFNSSQTKTSISISFQKVDSDTSSLSDTSGSDTTEYDTTDTVHIQQRIDGIMKDLRILLHKQH